MKVIQEMLRKVEVEQQAHLDQLSKMEEQTKWVAANTIVGVDVKISTHLLWFLSMHPRVFHLSVPSFCFSITTLFLNLLLN